MKFRFCGEADCPDWVLAEINTISRLSSVKLKLLGNVVAKGLINPPIDLDKAEKLFSDSKLDADIDLRACISCLSYIISSTVRYNCESGALLSELQQLGLPREHSTSIKKVVDDNNASILEKFKSSSMRINNVREIGVEVDIESGNAALDININGKNQTILFASDTVDVLLEDLKLARVIVDELVNNSYD